MFQYDWLFTVGIVCAMVLVGALIILGFFKEVADWFDQAHEQDKVKRSTLQLNMREIILALSASEDRESDEMLRQALIININAYRGR